MTKFRDEARRRSATLRKHFLALKIAKKSQNTPAKKYKFFVQLMISNIVTVVVIREALKDEKKGRK